MLRLHPLGLALCLAASAAEPFDPARLEREVLVTGATDPLECAIAPDGTIYFIERAGALKRWDPATRSVSAPPGFSAPAFHVLSLNAG